jgi:transposase-like protein
MYKEKETPMASNRMTADDSRSDAAKQAFLLNDPGFMQGVVQQFIQNLLDHEMSDYLQAIPYERSAGRRGYRSGHRPRTLKTRAGTLSLDVPTERSGRFRTAVFDRYQRSEQAFVLALQEMYLQGVSTRKVREITEELCATPVSASTVSRLVRQLDEDLTRWRNRRLVEPYPYLIVDARYERVRQNERIESLGVLVIIGVSGKGQRDIIGVTVANTESETSWTEAFRDLNRRGLFGVRLMVSDQHEGLVAGVRRCFQGALWQRCQKHFMDNVLALVAKRDRTQLRQALRTVFDAASLEHAKARLAEVVAEWRPRYPELADKLEAETPDTFACFHFPAGHRMRIRTTNMLERYNEELKRRTQVVRIFPNSASCLRLITALAQEQAAEWAGQDLYLDMMDLELWDVLTSPVPPSTTP